MTDALAQGAVIGILGGGQLGRMLSVAASRLGYRCHIYEPGAAPAGDVAHAVTTAPYRTRRRCGRLPRRLTSSPMNSRTFRHRPWTCWKACARSGPTAARLRCRRTGWLKRAF